MSERNGRSPWLDAPRCIDERPVVTIDLEELIVGANERIDDPSETYHEASRLYPGIVDPLVRGAQLLEGSCEMRVTVTRSVKRHAHLPAVSLPKPELGGVTLAAALTRRRSRRAYGEEPLELASLGTVLAAAYGVTGAFAETSQRFRTAPSGGALFPLELYVASRRVTGLEQALYHYDPLRNVLERLRPLEFAAEVEPLTPYPTLLGSGAAVIVLSAVFWRSRFKYGHRAYRFTLLEAGHVMQNALLAATALVLAGVPIGGFFARRADALIDADGLAEAVLYLLPLGRGAAE